MQLEKVFEGHNVRIALENDAPLFHLGDVLKAVESKSDTHKSIKSIDESYRFTKPVYSKDKNRNYDAYFINEYGLIELLLTLRVPKAKQFKKWAIEEVIPSVLKTGKYEAAPAKPQMPVSQTKEIERLDLLAKARDLGFISEEHAQAEAQIQIAVGMGRAPAIEQVFIYTESYLLERGCDKAFAKKFRSPFGVKVSQLYKARHGVKPPRHQGEVNGKITSMSYYTPKDKDLLDQAFEDYIQPKLDLLNN